MNKNNSHIKEFISNIIPDINNEFINWNWSVWLSWYLIDDWLAFWHYNNLKDILTPYKIQLNLYGKTYTKTVNILDVEQYSKYLVWFWLTPNIEKLTSMVDKISLEIQTKDSDNKYLSEATSIFSQHIWVYLKWNIIWDDFYQMLLKILDDVDVFEIEYSWKKELVFAKKIWKQHNTTTISFWEERDESKPITYSEEEDDKSRIQFQTEAKRGFDILLHKPINELTSDEFRYNNVMLLIKEVKDWFVDLRFHSLALKNKRWIYELHEYKLWEDIEILINKKESQVISVTKSISEYTTIKWEDWIWKVIKQSDPNFIPVPTDDFKYIDIENKEDWITRVKLIWAYTHILRDILWFKPQTWQYKFLLNQARMNYVAWVRRWWKTLVSSYLIIRFLYRQPSSRKHVLRQPKWIYTITSKDKFKAVLDYIEAQSNRIKVLKSLVYSRKQERLILSDDRLDMAMNKYQEVQATYDFTSSKWYKTWVGNWGDDIIIDEASWIPEDVWLNLAPIVTNEWAALFCISTIDWTTPKQWFYNALVHAERSNLPDIYALRVTIDDIDSNIMDDSAKAHAKRTLSHNMSRYLWELYATFASESQVFSSEGSVVLQSPIENNSNLKFEEIFLWYDPAKRSDFGWLLVAWLLNWTLYFIDEYQLQWDYSNYQRQVIFELKEKHLKENWKVRLIMDGTSAGDVVAEILWDIVDFKVWYTWDNWGNYRPNVDQFGSWKVSKTRLVTITQILFETKKIKILSSLPKLQWEIQTFKSYVSNWKTKFDAVSWEHDDLVNAMLLICFLYWYIDWKISYIEKDNNSTYRSIIWEHLNEKTWLYKEYFKTIRKDSDRRWVQKVYTKTDSWYVF